MDTLKVHEDHPPLAITAGTGNPFPKSLQMTVFGAFEHILQIGRAHV